MTADASGATFLNSTLGLSSSDTITSEIDSNMQEIEAMINAEAESWDRTRLDSFEEDISPILQYRPPTSTGGTTGDGVVSTDNAVPPALELKGPIGISVTPQADTSGPLALKTSADSPAALLAARKERFSMAVRDNYGKLQIPVDAEEVKHQDSFASIRKSINRISQAMAFDNRVKPASECPSPAPKRRMSQQVIARFGAEVAALTDAELSEPSDDQHDYAHGRLVLRQDIFHDVFLFQSPQLFQRALDILLLMNCLYLAVFFIYYVRQSYLAAPWAPLYLLTLPLPAVITLLMITGLHIGDVSINGIMESYSILKSLVLLQPDIVGLVVERMEEMHYIKETIRDRLNLWIGQLDHGQSGVIEIFEALDIDKNGKLTENEFRSGLMKMRIHLSARQFKRLLIAVDYNHDKGVSYSEFCDLIYGGSHWDQRVKSEQGDGQKKMKNRNHHIRMKTQTELKARFTPTPNH